MPHVVVKLWPGRNDEIKTNLAQKIANVVSEELKVDIGDIFISNLIMNINKTTSFELWRYIHER